MSGRGTEYSENVVYNRTYPLKSEARNLAVGKSMITGLQQTKPIIGMLARHYLGNIGKDFREYNFFGGFIGQGNISFFITLPENSLARNVFYEGYAGAD